MATRRKPEAPNARQVRVPSKKAAPIPETERPVTRIGDPAMKINILQKRADSHVAGDDWIRRIASDAATSAERALATGSIMEELGMGLELPKMRAEELRRRNLQSCERSWRCCDLKQSWRRHGFWMSAWEVNSVDDGRCLRLQRGIRPDPVIPGSWFSGSIRSVFYRSKMPI